MGDPDNASTARSPCHNSDAISENCADPAVPVIPYGPTRAPAPPLADVRAGAVGGTR